MNRNFWRDLYPTSETKRRLSRASWLGIYLPIAASALIAVGAAVAVVGLTPGDGFAQKAEMATIILAAGLMAAGFISWLIILASIWGLQDLLADLPDFTGRMRLRFVIGARSWKRGIYSVRRAAASIIQFFSPNPQGPIRRNAPRSSVRRGGDIDE